MDMSLPRAELALLPTPLVRASRLERALDVGPLFLKRDDLTGFGIAGNKARALEFLIGAAVAEKADVFVAAGSPSSNFCAAAAMAARVVGMDCDLLFPGEAPSVPSPNVELARAAGARLLFDAVDTRDLLDDGVLEHAKALRAEGRRPYAVPRGGATATGGLGYAYAARELADQCNAGRHHCADGGGGDRFRGHPGRSGRRTGRVRPALAACRRQREQAGSRHGRPGPSAVARVCSGDGPRRTLRRRGRRPGLSRRRLRRRLG